MKKGVIWQGHQPLIRIFFTFSNLPFGTLGTGKKGTWRVKYSPGNPCAYYCSWKRHGEAMKGHLKRSRRRRALLRHPTSCRREDPTPGHHTCIAQRSASIAKGGSQNNMQAREYMRRAFAIPRAFVRRARDSHWFGARLDVAPPLIFPRTALHVPPQQSANPLATAAPPSTRRVIAGVRTDFRRRKCVLKPFCRPR